MAAGSLVDEEIDIGIYGDEPDEPALPRKRVSLCTVNCFFGVFD